MPVNPIIYLQFTYKIINKIHLDIILFIFIKILVAFELFMKSYNVSLNID